MEKPIYFDELFALGIILLFLMINYDMPLSDIYQNMTYWILFGYLVPLIFSLFSWIPFYKKGELLKGTLIGIGAGVFFIFIYNSITLTPMANVFAATAYGDSVLLGKSLYSGPISFIESTFFFIIIPGWVLWKMGNGFSVNLFTSLAIFIIVLSGGIFMLYHSSSKGIENNKDLMATFIFGAISTGLVIFFKQWIEAIVMHVVVNSYATGLLNSLMGASSFLMYAGIGLIAYFLFTGKWKNIISA